MSEQTSTTGENQGAGTQTAERTTADNAGTQTGEIQKPSEAQSTQAKTFTQDEINRILAKEKKDWEKKVSEAEAKAKLSEDERLKSELNDYKTQIRERDARDLIKEEATKLGAKNAGLVYRALSAEIEFDDKGQVKNLKELFETAKTDFPELFAAVKPQFEKPVGGVSSESIEIHRSEYAQFDLCRQGQSIFE